ICGRRPNSGQRITSTSRNLVPSRSPSTKRWPILPRILIQCGGCLDATVKKAVWNSNKLRRFPRANLIIYSTEAQLKRLESVWGPLRDLMSAFGKINEIMANTPKAQNPYKDVGKVFKEYSEQMIASRNTLAMMQQQLRSVWVVNDQTITMVNAAMSELSKRIGTAKRLQASLENEFASRSRRNGQSSCPSDDDYVCNKFCPEYFPLGDVNPIDEN